MREIRNALAFASTVLAFAVLVPSVSAAPVARPLMATAECGEHSGHLPGRCTITRSSLAAIPPGTKISHYQPVTNNPAYSSNSVVLDDGAGNAAAGNCIVDLAGAPLGMCTFYAGSGSLAGFRAVVKVTIDANRVWHWEGRYLLGTITQ